MRAGFIFVFALVMVVASAATHAQDVANGALFEARTPPKSDRKQHGLRGSVKSCVEEITYPGVTGSDGTACPERTFRSEREFDLDGRLTTENSRSGDSELVTRYTYDSSGHLLRVTSGKRGEQGRETVYTYGEDGRLRKVTNNQEPDRAITYHYDEQGGKTSIQAFRASDHPPNVAMAGSPFEVNPNLPGGGTVTTVFDSHDRPTEVQVRDDKGEVVSRAVRTYDAEGRVLDEKQILDNPEAIIPADIRAKAIDSVRAETGATAEEVMRELREQITKVMGGQSGMFSIAYTYDTQGRAKETRRQVFNEEEKIETAYNDQGDKVSEITRSERIGAEKDREDSALGLPSYSEVRYSYQYDDHGNWTKQDVSCRSGADGTFQSSMMIRRTITYY